MWNISAEINNERSAGNCAQQGHYIGVTEVNVAQKSGFNEVIQHDRIVDKTSVIVLRRWTQLSPYKRASTQMRTETIPVVLLPNALVTTSINQSPSARIRLDMDEDDDDDGSRCGWRLLTTMPMVFDYYMIRPERLLLGHYWSSMHVLYISHIVYKWH